MGDTSMELRLDPPARVAGQDDTVARVAFWVDDPQAVVRLLRDSLGPLTSRAFPRERRTR